MLFEEVLARSSDLTLLPKTEGLQTHLHSSQERDFTPAQQMSFLRKGTDSLNKYIWKSKATCDDLASWLPLVILDQNKVFWLLQGLGQGYEIFVHRA